jgi:hypothetical protein
MIAIGIVKLGIVKLGIIRVRLSCSLMFIRALKSFDSLSFVDPSN